MEVSTNECRSIVYFSENAQHDTPQEYRKTSPPKTDWGSDGEHVSLRQTHHNITALLDDDQGGFEEVFVCSDQATCLERLDDYASKAPTVVLVELHGDYSAWQTYPPPAKDKKNTAGLCFLHRLGSDIRGARYQKHVLPFALVISSNAADAEHSGDPAMTTMCLKAGAVDVLRSPLQHEDINRIVGHIKEIVRAPAQLIAAQMAQNLVDSIHDYSEPRAACHRPDQKLSEERRSVVEAAVRKWHFPAQDFNMDELTYGAMCMMEHILSAPELEAYTLPRAELISFLLATRRQYKHEREVHYHNWRHAVDVTQSIYCFLLDLRLYPPLEPDKRKREELSAVERLLTPLDGLILIVSAIGHDVGHPGVNNAFLVACNHPLAQTYNDKSVLENYHCAAYSQLLRRHWPSLNNIIGFRATMISTILSTDMQRHFEYMKSLGELKAQTESSDASVDEWSDKDREHTRELIMALLMKAADISNVARPFDVSAKWAKILMNEFARQGELESELQIPTCLFGGPPDKEDILAAAQSQKGFMGLFGRPLFQGISEIMPTMSSAVQELENNGSIWDQKIEDEKERRKPRGNEGHLTLDSVTTEEAEDAAHHKSEPRLVPSHTDELPSTPTKRIVVKGAEPSPTRHPAHDLRQQLAQGVAMNDETRSSAPNLAAHNGGAGSPHGGSSRRSSKDVALDQLQQLTAFAHQSLNSPKSGSRRGSADAGWQIHQQSYPGSRRGSKDESLTATILVTSGSSPGRRSSPSSPGKSASPGKHSSKRQSVQQSSRGAPGRTSVPSSRSHATSTATAATTQHSPSTQPSTQPSSLAVEEDESRSMVRNHSIPSPEDPFMVPGNWPNDLDGSHRSPPLEGIPRELPSTPPAPQPLLTNSTSKADVSPRILAKVTSADTDDSRLTPQKSFGYVEKRVRESRSRSRLRGLKFWKKKKDKGENVGGMASETSVGNGDVGSGSP